MNEQMHVPTNTYVHTQVIEYQEFLSVALAMSVLFTFQVHDKPQFPHPVCSEMCDSLWPMG